MSNNNEYPIVFKGRGLENLKEIARAYGISEGETIIKAVKLLKLTKIKGDGTVIIRNERGETTINTNQL